MVISGLFVYIRPCKNHRWEYRKRIVSCSVVLYCYLSSNHEERTLSLTCHSVFYLLTLHDTRIYTKFFCDLINCQLFSLNCSSILLSKYSPENSFTTKNKRKIRFNRCRGLSSRTTWSFPPRTLTPYPRHP